RIQMDRGTRQGIRKFKKGIVKAIESEVRIFDQGKHTCLRTDWSKAGIGYVLMQKHCKCPGNLPDCCVDGWRITLAGSIFLSIAETRYAPVEGDMLAVVWSLMQTHNFTQGSDNLTVVTDHKLLVRLLGDKTLDEIPNVRLSRMKQRTMAWKFSILHRPGQSNHFADTTSRHPTGRPDYTDLEEELFMASVRGDFRNFEKNSWARIEEEYEADPEMTTLMEQINNGFPAKKTDIPTIIQPYWGVRGSLLIAQGVIMKGDRVVLSQSLRREALDALHSAIRG
ncbi:Uncharacterized protein FKW44_006394, partial [Caligus rogercresseyi]